MDSKDEVEGKRLLRMWTCLEEAMEDDIYEQTTSWKNIRDRGLSGTTMISL